MRTVVLLGLAIGLVTSGAMAEPLKLDDGQLASATAGVLSLGDVNIGVGLGLSTVVPTNVGVIASTAQAVNVLSGAPATAAIIDSLFQANATQPNG